MAEVVKRNFETGKLLLVAALLLSVNLIVQLFNLAGSLDVSNGISLSGEAIVSVTSYLLTAVSMIIVLQEFFQIKTKMKGLLALNALMERNPVPNHVSVDIQVDETSSLVTEEQVEKPFDEIVVDDESEFDDLLNELEGEELDETEEDATTETPELSEDEEIMARYKTTKIKIDEETGEAEPLIDEGGLQDLIEQADLATEEAEQLAKIVAESEIIQTLNELETIVQELKAKKAV